MRRFGWPAAAVAVLALAVWGASTVPVQQPSPVPSVVDDRTRVVVVCPNLAGSTAALTAGAPAGGVRLAPLAAPGEPTTSEAGFVHDGGVTAPMVVDAPQARPFSATVAAAEAAGPERGLSMTSCGRPRTAHWFTGVTSSATAVAEVVLLNADARDATADLTVHTAGGRLNAPGSRGIVVPARSARTVPLEPLFTLDAPVTLHVSASAGRVAAVVRQRTLLAEAPAGGDWLPPTADPATTIVIPGVPAGTGRRDLVVANPGERTATIALQVLGASGATAVPGFETLDLPAHSSRVVPLAGALAGAAAGLRLSSEQPVVAGVIGDAGSGDPDTQVATEPLTGGGVLAVAPGAAATTVLRLANGGGTPVEVKVRAVRGSSAAAGPRSPFARTVVVPALADVGVPLPKADNLLITVEPATPGAVHASLGVRRTIGDLAGTSSLAVLPGPAPVELPPVRHDPRAGG